MEITTGPDPRDHVVLFVSPLEEGEADGLEIPGTADQLATLLEADGWRVERHPEHDVGSQVAARHLRIWRPDEDDLADAAPSKVTWVHVDQAPSWVHDAESCEACRAVGRAYEEAVESMRATRAGR